MPRLIINADDFGLTPGINRAVGELHDAGSLTSATLMANGGAFDDAVRIALQRPSLGVGCHVVLVDGEPVSEAKEIPTLLGPGGKTFRPTLGGFVQALLLGQINPDDIMREARAQLRKLRQAGIQVTHLDTHKHTHMFPAVLRPLLAVAQEHSIATVRNPFEPAWSLRITDGGFIRMAEIRLLKMRYAEQFRLALSGANVTTSDGGIGILATGVLDIPALQSMLLAMPEGTWELVCHPGHIDAALHAVNTRLLQSREIERDALATVFADLKLNHPNIELIHYGALGGPGMPSASSRPDSESGGPL